MSLFIVTLDVPGANGCVVGARLVWLPWSMVGCGCYLANRPILFQERGSGPPQKRICVFGLQWLAFHGCSWCLELGHQAPLTSIPNPNPPTPPAAAGAAIAGDGNHHATWAAPAHTYIFLASKPSSQQHNNTTTK